MRKTQLSGLALISGLMLMTSACNNDVDSTSLSIKNFPKTNVKVYAYADLDISTPGLEKAPQGTKLVISAENSAFNPGTDGQWTDTLVVNAEGFAEKMVPVTKRGVSYTIKPVDFEEAQIQATTDKETTVNKIYNAVDDIFTLTENKEEIRQISYSAKNYEDYVEMVDVTLYINGEFNLSAPGNEAIPGGISIEIQGTSSKWSTTISAFEAVLVDGANYSKATIAIKKGEVVKVLPFVADKTMADGSVRSFIYSRTLGSFAINGEGSRFTLSDKLNIPN